MICFKEKQKKTSLDFLNGTYAHILKFQNLDAQHILVVVAVFLVYGTRDSTQFPTVRHVSLPLKNHSN